MSAVTVRFERHYDLYLPGDVASFPAPRAAALVARGVAAYPHTTAPPVAVHSDAEPAPKAPHEPGGEGA